MHFDSLKGWLSWQEGFHAQTIDLGLERVNAVYKRLMPNGTILPTLTVAGTNGKGSCIALLSEIYRAQGYRVGAFTSPHIITYNERICIDGTPVADEMICAAFERIEACRNDISLSFFEFSALAALDIFSREHLDVQLLEVGLGGRLDAVNIIDADAAIISSIGIDHADWLGDTREAIAIEKAGIFRANSPAIIGDPEPPSTLIDAAHTCDAKLFCINKDFTYECSDQHWSWKGFNKHYTNLPFPALKGRHQFLNASTILAAIEYLHDKLPVEEQAIQAGLINVQLKGRFQLINAEVPILLDVGHNPQAVGTLYEYITEIFPHKRIHAVFAMMKDKDIPEVIKIMQPLVHSWIIAPLDNPRAASIPMLETIFKQAGISRVIGGFIDFNATLKHALTLAKTEDLIVIFGSFFLVSAFLADYAGEDLLAPIEKGTHLPKAGIDLSTNQDTPIGEAMCQ